MKRCVKCLIPDTRPDTEFVDGVCSACISYAKRPKVDWQARRADLLAILKAHDMRCIVPSSGGKDSTWQVLTLLELGADVTVVTATTCQLTDMGRHNIDNLKRFARTIEISPNQQVRAKLNRIGLEMVGDISWPEHIAIHRAPFRAAVDLGIPLIFYGECPQEAYGGPPGTAETRVMTQRWASEFAGFLGLRPQDVMGLGEANLSDNDLEDYLAPPDEVLSKAGVTAYFLGQFFEWDSHRNAEVAQANGFMTMRPWLANWWDFENLDNAQTGLHDHLMYRKYGYGRGCAQISVDIRRGLIGRAEALEFVLSHDGLFPHVYMGVPIGRVLHRIGVSYETLRKILYQFTNRDLFEGEVDDRPLLKPEWDLQSA